MEDNLGIQLFQMIVLLAHPHEDNGGFGNIGHGNDGADLIANGIELGQNDAVYGCGAEGGLEHSELIDAVVADEGLAYEEYAVGLVLGDEFGEGFHEG